MNGLLMLNAKHDKKFDILYVGMPDFKDAVGSDGSHDITIMRDAHNKVRGYIFMDFLANYRDGVYSSVHFEKPIDLARLYNKVLTIQ